MNNHEIGGRPTSRGAHAERTAIVTGAGRGIGIGIARRLLEGGAQVALVDIDANALQTALGDLGSLAQFALAIPCDVSDADAVVELVDRTIGMFGKVDILVNNAGISPKHDGRKAQVAQMSIEEWRRVLDVNLTSSFLCARACLPTMLARKWGRIVNISSQAGRTRSELSGAHYGASKAGMASLARTLACEVGRSGVTVNAVAPGRIMTPMAETVSQEVNEKYMANIPVGRFGTPEDVAAAVCFLASDDAGFITGTTLDVNGGAFMI